MRRTGFALLRGLAVVLAVVVVLSSTVGCRSTSVRRGEIPNFRSWFAQFDGDRRVSRPLPTGFGHYGQSHRDVVLAIIPNAVAGWRPGSLAGDHLFDADGLRGVDHRAHRGFELLNRNGIFVAATDEGRRNAVLSQLLDRGDADRERPGVPAFVVVEGLPKEEWPVVVVTSEILVRFQRSFLDDPGRGVSPRDRVDRLLRDRWDARVVRVHSADPRLHLIRVGARGPQAWLRIAREIKGAKECDGIAEPNLLVPHVAHSDDPSQDVAGTPTFASPPPTNDPLVGKQWPLAASGALSAWNRPVTTSRGSNDVVVAILEPHGVQVTHPDLVDNQAPDLHWNFDDDSSNPQKDREAPDGKPIQAGHGTATAGLVAASAGNGLGVSGVAPGCRFMAICLGSSIFEDIEAFDHAREMGAAVLSNSWAYPTGLDVPDSVRCAIYRAVTKGRDGKGCVVLFSLTNKTRDNFADTSAWANAETLCADVGYWSTVADWTWFKIQAETVSEDTAVWRPLASMPEVMAIGRCTDTEKWGQCGYGAGMSLVGPSNAQGSTETRSCDWTTFLGVADVVTTDLTDEDGENPKAGFNWGKPVGEATGACACSDFNGGVTELNDGDYTVCFKGTSAAVPIVAGVAALVISEYPEATSRDVRRLLESTAVPVDADQGKWVSNPETGDAYSPRLGHGRVNAGAACEAAAELRESRKPRVALSVSGPSRAAVGDTVTFYLTATNEAAAPVQDVVLTNVLPAGWTHVTHSGDALLGDDRLKWALGTLPANSGRWFTVTCRASSVGAATNYVEVLASGAETVSSSTTVTVFVPLAVTVTAPASATVGYPESWTVAVHNASDLGVEGVRLRNPFPKGVTADMIAFGSGSDDVAVVPPGAVKSTDAIVWEIGSLRAGESRYLTYTIRTTAPLEVVNSAYAEADGATLGEDTASVWVNWPTH